MAPRSCIQAGASVPVWLETGTELLAYRTTYGITDPVVALGPTPDPTESRRWSWHSKLTTRLRAYH